MPFDLTTTIDLDKLTSIFRECTPHLLVVTDGNLNSGTNGFGLSRFISALQTTTIHGMTPIVTSRARHGTGKDSAFADLEINRYDVLFLFGWNGETDALEAATLTRITRFMQAGGGLFATGDHEDMGAGLCGQIPRVRAMRFWAPNQTPDIGDATRLTTNLAGIDHVFGFDDQSDALPQRLYANYALTRNRRIFLNPFMPQPNVRSPHPLLRLPGRGALEVFPDHPHEGECRIAANQSTTFAHEGQDLPEWPATTFFLFGTPMPQHVASTMSHGNGFDTGPTGPKEAVVPRAFIALAAYDGHGADVGRVVTDATWHHYVNVNLVGLGGQNLDDITAYYRNLATWLIPAKTRRCLRPIFILERLKLHPFAEELRNVADEPRPAELRRLGRTILAILDAEPGDEATELVSEALLTLVDAERLAGATDGGDPTDDAIAAVVADLIETAIGGAVLAVAAAATAGGLDHESDLFTRALLDTTQATASELLDEHVAAQERALRAVEATKAAIR